MTYGWQRIPEKRIRGRLLQLIRRRHFERHPLCVVCESKGKVRQATELDHIVALSKGGLDIESNRQGLCAECHAEKTAKDLGHRERQRIGPDGYPVED